MDLITHYRLRKLASDKPLRETSLGRRIAGIGGALAGAAGADMLHTQIARRTPKYGEFISSLLRKANQSPSRWGRVGAGLGAIALAGAPMVVGAYGGYKAGTKLNDISNGR